MNFPSLLYSSVPEGTAVDVFNDLKLDMLLSSNAIEAMRTLCRVDDIPLRQAVYSDVAASLSVFETLLAFALKAHTFHKFYYSAESEPERDYVFIMLMNEYAGFVNLAAKVNGGVLTERFRNAFEIERGSAAFAELERQLAERLPMIARVSAAKFTVRGDNLKINRAEDAPSLAERVYKCAAGLELGVTEELCNPEMRMNSRIYHALALLFPEEFRVFREFYERFGEHFNAEFLKYAAELNMYVEAVRLFGRAKTTGLPAVMPELSADVRFIAEGLCDISLLAKETNPEIVANDAFFTLDEPFFFLTGANGGGKTTYLRSVGIAALFARSGLPVAAKRAAVYPFADILAHFPRDEHGESRLAEEERRVGEILERSAGGGALVLLNETYSTTTYEKSAELTSALSETLAASGSLTLYITHQLSAVNSELPVLTAAIDADGGNRRTFKIVRAEGRTSSFARDILVKYGLNKEALC